MISRLLTIALACACLFLGLELERMRPYWPQSRTIEQTSASPSAPSHAVDEAMLRVVIPQASLDKLPLDKALATLTDRTSVNIVADWTTIKYMGLLRTTPVTVYLRNVTLAQALDQIARYLENENGKLSFYVADGVVTLTSSTAVAAKTVAAAKAAKQVTTVFIDLRPLVREVQKVSVPAVAPECRTGIDIIAATQPATSLPAPAYHLGYTEVVDDIIKLIINTVDPESWRDNGGSIGSISRIGGVLVITSTPQHIRQIRTLLDALHKTAVAGNAPPNRAVLGSMFGGGPTSRASDGITPAKMVTESFNLRPLVEQLVTGGEPPPQAADTRYLGDVVRDISHLISTIVAPESWQDSGGGPGLMNQIAWALIVTQTPGNLAKARNVLDCLARASVARHFPPPSLEAVSANFIADKRIFFPDDTRSDRKIEFVNVRPLVKQFSMRARSPHEVELPPTSAEILERIYYMIMEGVEPETWEDNGGTIGTVRAVDLVLVFTHKPKTLQKIHETLDCLRRASVARHFPPRSFNAHAGDFVRDERITCYDDTSGFRNTAADFINIDPLLERLAGAGQSKRDYVTERIYKWMMKNIDPDSWFDAGGKAGSVRVLEPVLIVSQTPRNLEKAWKMLECLDRASVAIHFAPHGAEASIAAPETTPSESEPNSTTVHVTAYINILPLNNLWLPHAPKLDGAESSRRIADVVEAAVAPTSWFAHGNWVDELGNVLVVTSTPQRVEVVRNELEALYQKMLGGDFPPTSQRAVPTTQAGNGK